MIVTVVAIMITGMTIIILRFVFFCEEMRGMILDGIDRVVVESDCSSGWIQDSDDLFTCVAVGDSFVGDVGLRGCSG